MGKTSKDSLGRDTELETPQVIANPATGNFYMINCKIESRTATQLTKKTLMVMFCGRTPQVIKVVKEVSLLSAEAHGGLLLQSMSAASHFLPPFIL